MLKTIIYNPPSYTQLDILYQNKCHIISNKPSGLLSDPTRGKDKQVSDRYYMLNKFHLHMLLVITLLIPM